MAHMNTTLSSYAEARDYLRSKDSRKLGHNTFVEARPGGDIAVRYHRTDIITFRPDGRIVLDTGGWLTTTTKQRLSAIIPGVRVWAERGGEWAVSSPNGRDARYEDCMYLDSRGTFDEYTAWRWAVRDMAKSVPNFSRSV